ncbi:response regulator transcription factor [Pseudonocardia lacus]|uniref:response regulator transcription factor n=1 Tax=Pseudonocardia lacus TaxID=2835865 RepID=UPI0027E303B0|nr:response regulator transcription factor [Pseudonocardia lacus]
MSSPLDSGRAANRRRDWRDAFAELSAADREQPLHAADLESLAMSAYMLGRDDDARRALERAYAVHVDQDDAAGAARCAFWISLGLLSVGESARANGWARRADRLLDRMGHVCVEHGYRLVLGVLAEDGDPDAALSIADIGERFHDADLVAFALYARGDALVKRGRVGPGLALFDEAMVAVLAGELSSALLTGLIYCLVIGRCEEVYEVGRTREWTDALTRWCEAQPQMVNFTGTCLVHRAGSLQLRGAWPAAVAAARQACRRFVSGGPGVGAARYRLGEIHRLRGELAAAEEAFREASERGWQPQPGLSLLWLAQDRTANAAAAIRRVLAETADRLARARLLPACVEIMLAAGDVAQARAAGQELTGIAGEHGSTALVAMARYATGAVALAEGDPAAALLALREAGRLWHEVEAPYEVARTRTLIGLACRRLDDEDSAAWEFAAARDCFARLGAAPDLARLTALVGPGPPDCPGGLTARELEVLRLVAAGRSNRVIAELLVLSERTVDRHVSNILTKLDVPSRTAATAFAYDHGLLQHHHRRS